MPESRPLIELHGVSLSDLQTLIDEMLEAKEASSVFDAGRLIAEARALLAPAETGSGFAKHYFDALQRDPDAVLAHAEMKKLLAALSL